MDLAVLSLLNGAAGLNTAPGLVEDKELDAVQALAGSRVAFRALINCD